MTLTVISFFTPDWKYPEYAKSLEQDCERLGLTHHIESVPSLGAYTKNCNIKPDFIRSQLQHLKSPVLWMDVDGSILKCPDILLEKNLQNYDIAGNRPSNNKERIHVGSIWFNYTKATLGFLDSWCETVHHSIDDAALNGVWNIFKNNLAMLELPPEYFFIHKRSKDPIPPDTVILHRLSASDLKIQYKNLKK
jgi:hypothetical protein